MGEFSCSTFERGLSVHSRSQDFSIARDRRVQSLDETRRLTGLLLSARPDATNRLNGAHALNRMQQRRGSRVVSSVFRTVASPRGLFYAHLLSSLSLSTSASAPFPIAPLFTHELLRRVLTSLLACDFRASRYRGISQYRVTSGRHAAAVAVQGVRLLLFLLYHALRRRSLKV